MAVDIVNYEFSIPYLVTVNVPITITENLMETGNEILLNLLSVNASQDAIIDNNSDSVMTDLDPNFDNVTLVINSDDYPEETSWQLFDEETNEVVGFGNMEPGQNTLTEQICVNYSSCFRIEVYDSYGDGICCDYGIGDFYMLDSSGDILLTNNGDFGDFTEESFCLGEGCFLSAEITTTIASSETATDGVIMINPVNGIEPFEYSIDGGENFVSNNVFENLASGNYDIVVMGAMDNCIFEASVLLEFDMTSSILNNPLNSIKLYPNPTQETFVIEIDQNLAVSRHLKMDIYNSLGMLIYTDSNMNFDSNSKTPVSLNNYSSGAYTVKIYNSEFEKYFGRISKCRIFKSINYKNIYAAFFCAAEIKSMTLSH